MCPDEVSRVIEVGRGESGWRGWSGVEWEEEMQRVLNQAWVLVMRFAFVHGDKEGGECA